MCRSKLDIENLLCEPSAHARKKSFQRHFEQKILKPKLALTFNKKKGAREGHRKFARVAKQKKLSSRGFDAREALKESAKKAPRVRAAKAKRKRGLRTKKKNVSSGKRLLDMFASQTLNQELREPRRGKDGRRGTQCGPPGRAKFSTRKNFRKDSNPLGPSFKAKKSLFMDLDWLRKGLSFAKREAELRKRTLQPKAARKPSRRPRRKAKEYNASCSNHPAEPERGFRVKLDSMKSFSKADNMVAADTFEKFFRVFRKKQTFRAAQSREDPADPLGSNIYRAPRSRFKSFRQLTMQRRSKRNASKPVPKQRERSLDQAQPAARALGETGLDPRKLLRQNFYKHSEQPGQKTSLGDNIYHGKGRREAAQKSCSRAKDPRAGLCWEVEGDVEKFHREYIKIDCMESDSGSELSGFGVPKAKARLDGFPGGLQDLNSGNKRGAREGGRLPQINPAPKPGPKEKENQIYGERAIDATNLSSESESRSGESRASPKPGQRAAQEERAQAKQKIKKVRLIDSYNLGFLYHQPSPLRGPEGGVHCQKLRNMLAQPKAEVSSKGAQKRVVENLSQEWAADFDEQPEVLDFICIEKGDQSSLHLENISLQKSISEPRAGPSPAGKRPILYKNSFALGRDEPKLSESERKPREEETPEALVNYESEKSFRRRFRRQTKFPFQGGRKRSGAKRRSEHGVPLKMPSLRERKVKMALRRRAERGAPGQRGARESGTGAEMAKGEWGAAQVTEDVRRAAPDLQRATDSGQCGKQKGDSGGGEGPLVEPSVEEIMKRKGGRHVPRHGKRGKERAFRMVKILGQGAFANVYMVEAKNTGWVDQAKTGVEDHEVEEPRGDCGAADHEPGEPPAHRLLVRAHLPRELQEGRPEAPGEVSPEAAQEKPDVFGRQAHEEKQVRRAAVPALREKPRPADEALRRVRRGRARQSQGERLAEPGAAAHAEEVQLLEDLQRLRGRPRRAPRGGGRRAKGRRARIAWQAEEVHQHAPGGRAAPARKGEDDAEAARSLTRRRGRGTRRPKSRRRRPRGRARFSSRSSSATAARADPTPRSWAPSRAGRTFRTSAAK